MFARRLTVLGLLGLVLGLAARQLAGQAPAVESAEQPATGTFDPVGWRLEGPQGRHYVFGDLAVGDYTLQGKRHIVTMQLEDPALHAKADDKFLYFREVGSARRWAIGRHPLADDTYAVYAQSPAASAPAAKSKTKTASQPKWTLFHRALLTWPTGPQPAETAQGSSAACAGSK